jgi:ParB-like chromosome segregation protein Spo0J
MNGIHESLSSLALPVSSLVPLKNNPRRGDIEAIAASYKEFGQVKPIVVTENGDGRYVIIAGNHQFEAAKSLGWDSIACTILEGDEKKAMAYAYADNRTADLGGYDEDLLMQLIGNIGGEYSDLMSGLGIDEFDMAAIEDSVVNSESNILTSSEFVPPVMVTEETQPVPQVPKGDELNVAALGSTAIPGVKKPAAVVQYTIVFDSVEQQSRWYDFVKWLRSDPEIDGSTTAERLLNYLEAHCDF